MKFKLRFNKWLLAILVVYTLLFFYRLTEIGPEYDESLYVNAALGCPNKFMFLHLFYPVGKTCIPLMVMPYVGATQAYFVRLVFTFLGTSVFTLRLTNYLLMSVSLLLIYLAVKKMLNGKIAFLTLFLLLFDSHLLLASRYDKTLIAPFFIRAIFIYVMSISRARFPKIKPFLLGFLMGFLLFTKQDTYFLLVSIIVGTAFVLLYRRDKRGIFIIQERLRMDIPWLAIGFSIGIFPLLIYLRRSYKTVIEIGRMMATVPNEFWKKILYIVTQFSADQLFDSVFAQHIMHKVAWLSSATIFAIFMMVVVSIIRKKKPLSILAAVSIVFYLFVIFFSGFGAWGKSHHLLMLYPVPQIIIAYYLFEINKKLIKFFLMIFIFTFMLSYYDFSFLSWKTCGRNNYSCSIRKVLNYVGNDKKTIVAGDWGLATSLMLLTGGRREINELAFVANSLPEKEVYSTMEKLEKECSYFILYTPQFTRLLRARNVMALQLKGNSRYVKKTIVNKENQPYIEIYSCIN